MKKALLALVLVTLSAVASAGKCQLDFNSQEPGRLRFMAINRQSLNVPTLAACVQKAQSQLGKTVRAQSLVRDEQRVLTSVRYRFVAGNISSSGTIHHH